MGRKWLMAGVWILTVGVGAAACGGGVARGDADSAVSESIGAGGGAQQALSWRFEAPQSWDDRVRLVDDPEGEKRLAEQGIRAARLFEYLPHDTTVAPQALLGIYVYDSTAWARLEAEEGPPQGELVTRGAGVAYVAGFPQSNPFAPGSADSVEFDKRTVTMEYVRRAFRVVP